MLTTGILDPERETSLDEVLAALELPAQRFQAELVFVKEADVGRPRPRPRHVDET